MLTQTSDLSISIYKKGQSYEMYTIGLFYKKFVDNFKYNQVNPYYPPTENSSIVYNPYYRRQTEKDYILFDISQNLMIDCFTIASSQGNINAMYELALYYKSIQQYKLMNKYFFMAIKKGCIHSMFEVGKYYDSNIKFHCATKDRKILRKLKLIQKSYLMAINRGHIEALYHFSLYYKNLKLYDHMIYYLKIAVENDYFMAALELGNYYADVEPDEELMLQYYKICYKNNIRFQNFNLLKYYNNDIMRLYGWLKSLELENNATSFLMRDLKTYREVKSYLAEENKHVECPICLDKKLLVKIKSCCNGHEVCVDCYWKMDRRCYYRCEYNNSR